MPEAHYLFPHYAISYPHRWDCHFAFCRVSCSNVLAGPALECKQILVLRKRPDIRCSGIFRSGISDRKLQETPACAALVGRRKVSRGSRNLPGISVMQKTCNRGKVTSKFLTIKFSQQKLNCGLKKRDSRSWSFSYFAADLLKQNLFCPSTPYLPKNPLE